MRFHIFYFLLFSLGCKDAASDSMLAQYPVTINGSVTNLAIIPLDSVRVGLSNPLLKDSTKEGGVFELAFNTFSTNIIDANIQLSRRKFYDTAVAVSYGPSRTTIELGRITMRGIPQNN
jgi:hypothetical protein